MELALNLGKTVEELSREMTAVEFDLWQRYARRTALPMRRVEMYLAQIALKIVQVMGSNTDSRLVDYMFDPEEDDGAELAPEDAPAYFGFAPRK